MEATRDWEGSCGIDNTDRVGAGLRDRGWGNAAAANASLWKTGEVLRHKPVPVLSDSVSNFVLLKDHAGENVLWAQVSN